MIPLLFMTDEDGDRWCMPVAGDGPLYELGKLGSDTVRIHLSWTPADAPQTFTTTGDEARRLELLTRQLAAQAMACDATAVVEAIFLWEQEQLKREAAEREIQTTRTEMQATIDSLRIELDAALARAAETERRRVETAQRLTNVEADRVRLERQIKDMERSEVGELSGKLADALEEVVRLTNALNRANDENASLNEKLGEARRKNAKAMRELNKYRENDILLQSCAVGSPAA
jgi:chromosome segregation ATPase